MLLAIDSGNSSLKLGLYRGTELRATWRLVQERLDPVDDYGTKILERFGRADIDLNEVKAVIIASVVPQMDDALRVISARYFELTPTFVDHTMNTGLKILYDRPSELGADRIVSAVAAVEKYGAPCIVIDFGTATTFNAINSKREYLGGIIAPGVVTSANALFSRTAKLPRVPVERPKKLIATSTIEAIQSGCFYGYASLVDGLIERMREVLEGSPQVIATGGMAPLMQSESKCIDRVDPTLTLDGLRIIHERA